MQPCSPTQQNRLEIASFLDDEHADTELFDGLAALRFINKCFAGRGEAQVVCDGQAGAQHIVVLRARCACSCLMLATWWAGTLVAEVQGEQSDHSGKTALTLKALTKKNVRHVQSCSQTQVSHSLIVSCAVFLGCAFRPDFQGRRNFGLAIVLHVGTSGAHERFQQCSH